MALPRAGRGTDTGPLGGPLLSGTRMLVVDPLGPVGYEVGPPWIGLVPVYPWILNRTEFWGVWLPGQHLDHSPPEWFRGVAGGASPSGMPLP